MKRFIAIFFVLLFNLVAVAHAQRNLKDIPDPDPEIERKSFILPEGFEVNLYAADPLIAKPIQMNFDAQGRLWIASSEVYPQIKPGQKPTDKILVLEDKNGDGKADETKVFADGLFIPTGVLPGDGGVYVANSTELIHLKDTNADGKADVSRIVLSGFGTEDTHHLLHTLRWGHDGQLYMNQSIYIHSHIETPYGVKRLNGGGIWRFRPETMELDVFAYGLVNAWGHHFDLWGQSFATDGAGGEGINYMFPGTVCVATPGAPRVVKGLNPGSPKYCGLEILSGRHLPDDWQGNMITNDFRAHRVCRYVVTEDGSGYASKQETELIKTSHQAFRPIDVKMGPDGAIYIADWYNPIIQHGEVDFRDERRDHVHGRIWRVTNTKRPPLKTAISEKATIPELLEMLKTPEEWTRLWAKLSLKAKGEKDVLPAVATWVKSLDKNDPLVEHHRLEALWLYQNLNVANADLLNELLVSTDPRVRAAAVRVLSQWRKRIPNAVPLLATAVNDDHARVRLEAVRALAEVGTVEAAGYAAKALDRKQDVFLDFAQWKTFRDLSKVWVPALKDGSFDFGGNVDHLTFALKAVDSPDIAGPLLNLIKQNKVPEDRVAGILQLIASLGGANEASQVLDMLIAGTPKSTAQKVAVFTALIDAAHLRKTIPAGDLSRLEALMNDPDLSLRIAAIKASGAWKVAKLKPAIMQFAKNSELDERLRLAAIESLAEIVDPETTKVIRELTDAAHPPKIRVAAISALARRDVKSAAATAAYFIARTTDEFELTTVVAAITAQKGGPAALAKTIEGQSIPGDAAKLLLRQARASSQVSPELLAAIQKAGNLADAGWKATPELIAAVVAESQSQGNAERGEAIYRRKDMQCTKCHAIGGAGGVVGPGFESIGASAPPDYIVESILDPAKKVKEGFHSQMVATDEGRVFTGIPVRENAKELVLRDAEDRIITIAKDGIEERKDGRSLMPDGMVNELTRGELIDLVRFMSELGKVGGKYAIGKSRVVRRWQVTHLEQRNTHSI